MSMTKIMELRNKRASLWGETKNFLETHRGENGMVDAASVEQYDRMTTDVKALGEEIKRLGIRWNLKHSLPLRLPLPYR